MKTYVQSCPECQRVAKQLMKVPLVNMPVFGEPFAHIAMDVIGTSSGHQYISDYPARYPEVYPLRRFTAISYTT